MVRKIELNFTHSIGYIMSYFIYTDLISTLFDPRLLILDHRWLKLDHGSTQHQS